MFKETIKEIKIAFLLLLSVTFLTGIIYPSIVTVLSQLFFPQQAQGSLIEQDGKIIGSQLIGQSFTNPAYFFGRPSATSPFAYNGAASSGSNLGPLNPDFLARVKQRIDNLRQLDSNNQQLIPVDLVTASGSGLDPEISPLAALYQVPRIAKLRHLSEKNLQAMINKQIENRTFRLLGEPRVNVLQLNLSLDELSKPNKKNDFR